LKLTKSSHTSRRRRERRISHLMNIPLFGDATDVKT
jgi:hypothetical protein